MARARLPNVASQLTEVGRRFYARGWVLGTSGNFSVVSSRQPLRLAVTASSVHKGQLGASDVLLCDERGVAVGRTSPDRDSPRSTASRKPSAETLLHLEVVKRRQAGAV